MTKSKKKYRFQGTGLTKTEKRWGKKRFKEYSENNHIETHSDLILLEELVYRETIHERYKKKVEELSRELKGRKTKDGKHKVSTEIIPKHMLNAMNDNTEQMLVLREKLGLFENQKDNDPLKYIYDLEEKFKKWKEDHWDERKVSCPFCSKIFFLNIRTDKYTANKSPFFEGKVIANKPLFLLYKKGKITKQEVAEVLGVSPDYVDWLSRNYYPTDNSSK